MSLTVLSKKVQDVPVTAFLDQSWVLWVCAEDVLQLLRLPPSVLQSIPLRHKKCWNDFRCPNSVYRLDGSRLFIDIYGLGNLCNRVNSNQSDYLCTLFIAEIYRDACIQSNSGCVVPPIQPQPPICPLPDFRPNNGEGGGGGCLPPVPPLQPDCNRPPNYDILERISKQNDVIINGLSQLCINSSNQHLEINNALNTIKLQNITITGQLTQLIDLLENQLVNIAADLRSLLDNFDTKLNNFLDALNKALAQLQDSVRNELTNINSILNNLTSSVTNINATLQNLLHALAGLEIGALTEQLDAITQSVEQILAILTPELPLGGKQPLPQIRH
ncbi:calyx/pep [Ectropis obliqua nucleopolyhedrovirus]|uniref:Calyx/pep n=1 Tax=Ectropis obliqua nucleopolyhedrovirus TaxID=59376 RepID=A0EZ11_9ABAC|nr:calyx/pep [Ectropis obliqua nucleopolyhedrovirus]ABI35791.1 calyx/pep [Ectropis obliqua nucleopolyhedrovirus]